MNHYKLFLLFWLLVFAPAAQGQYSAFTVEVTGQGDPVMLLPGFTCTAQVWQQTVAAISANHQCHAFTFAGFGGVPPIDMPWLPTIKNRLIDYIRQNKLKPVTIIGHSLGGTLGMWLTTSEPTLFRKLIAVDALPCTGALLVPDFSPAKMVYDNPYSKQQLSMDSVQFRQMAKQMVTGMCLNPARHTQLINWMLQADRKTYVNGYIDLLRLDLRDALADMTVPMVILAATHPSRQLVETTWNDQLAKLKNKHIEYAEQSAHFIMYDQPAWFIAKVNEHLQD